MVCASWRCCSAPSSGWAAQAMNVGDHGVSSPNRRCALRQATWCHDGGSRSRAAYLASSTVGCCNGYSVPNSTRSGPSRSSAYRATAPKQPDVSARMLGCGAICVDGVDVDTDESAMTEHEGHLGEPPGQRHEVARYRRRARPRQTAYTGCPAAAATRTSSLTRDRRSRSRARPARSPGPGTARPGPIGLGGVVRVAEVHRQQSATGGGAPGQDGRVVRVATDLAARLDDLARQPVQVDDAAGATPRPGRSHGLVQSAKAGRPPPVASPAGRGSRIPDRPTVGVSLFVAEFVDRVPDVASWLGRYPSSWSPGRQLGRVEHRAARAEHPHVPVVLHDQVDLAAVRGDARRWTAAAGSRSSSGRP